MRERERGREIMSERETSLMSLGQKIMLFDSLWTEQTEEEYGILYAGLEH